MHPGRKGYQQPACPRSCQHTYPPGEFTARERFNAAVWANVLFYLICGVLGFVALVFVVVYYGPTQAGRGWVAGAGETE